MRINFNKSYWFDSNSILFVLFGNSKHILNPSSLGMSILSIEAKLYFPESSTFSEYLFQDATSWGSLKSSLGSSSKLIVVSLALNSWFLIVLILLRDSPEFPVVWMSSFGLFNFTFGKSGIDDLSRGILFLKYSKGIILKFEFFFYHLMWKNLAALESILRVISGLRSLCN